MIPALKSEFRKLLTVRSTYIWTIVTIVFMLIIAGYVEGWRLTAQDLQSPIQLSNDVLGALSLSIVGAIIAILLMTHEYRYNTIMYTLTATKSRSKVLVSKIIVISVYAIALTILIGVLSPIASYVGVHLHGHTLVPQTLHIWDLVWRSLFYGWATAMAGLLLAVLIRMQIGAIVALFLIPGLVEQLLAQLLKSNAVYMPFTSLGQVIGTGPAMGGGQLAPTRAAAVFLIYLTVVWIIAWFLFLRRDAN